jgi:hypothetical protein
MYIFHLIAGLIKDNEVCNDVYRMALEAGETISCGRLAIIVAGYPHQVLFDEQIDFYIDKPFVKKICYYRYVVDLDLNPVDDFFCDFIATRHNEKGVSWKGGKRSGRKRLTSSLMTMKV